jgi:hypothetical protein
MIIDPSLESFFEPFRGSMSIPIGGRAVDLSRPDRVSGG